MQSVHRLLQLSGQDLVQTVGGPFKRLLYRLSVLPGRASQYIVDDRLAVVGAIDPDPQPVKLATAECTHDVPESVVSRMAAAGFEANPAGGQIELIVGDQNLARRDLEKNMNHMLAMRDRLYDGIKTECHQVRLNGHPEKRLPNTLSISFHNYEANRILEKIGSEVVASAGAACHSDTVEVSHVLKAMGTPLDWAKGTLRLTTGRHTTADEIDKAVDVISEAVKKS